MIYHAPTKIVFGSGALSGLKDIVERELGVSRPLLITDRGIIRSGIADRVLSQLGGIPVFDGVEQNPKSPTVNRAGEFAREQKPDLVIGLGGGSSLDAAKAVALLATNPGRIEDYEGRARYKKAPLPVVAIPTTCGTGSEVTWVAVVTHAERNFKMGIKGPLMFPAVAVVDPDLLATLPPPLVASTALDALTHAIEALTAKPANPMTDIWAKAAFLLVLRHVRDAFRDLRSYPEAREGMMLGSLLAGLAFDNSDVGAVHCLAESIGALYDIPHGVANAIFLPFVMDFNFEVSAVKYADLARLAGIDDADDSRAAKRLIQKIQDLSRTLEIPTFASLGIEAGKLPEIAVKSFENNSNPSNPRSASADDYLGILRRALFEQAPVTSD